MVSRDAIVGGGADFEDAVARLGNAVEALEPDLRVLFLLGIAERHAALYGLFENLRDGAGNSYRGLLDEAWDALGRSKGPVDPELAPRCETLVPGEDTVVDGFHDALGQYVGGVLADAAVLLTGAPTPVDGNGVGALEALRTVACMLELGYFDAGDDEEGRLFEAGLAEHPLVASELRFWEALYRLIQRGVAGTAVRRFAAANMLDVAQFGDRLVERSQ